MRGRTIERDGLTFLKVNLAGEWPWVLVLRNVSTVRIIGRLENEPALAANGHHSYGDLIAFDWAEIHPGCWAWMLSADQSTPRETLH